MVADKNLDNDKKPLKSLSNSEFVFSSLLAGAIAGACAKTSIAPLDRTKISFQISTNEYSAKKAWRFLQDTYRKEGFLNLWRGNSATMARIVPYAAIQFSAHEQWKKLLKVDSVDSKNESKIKRFLAGSLAGVTSQTLTYPLDLARARMAVTSKTQYQNLKHIFTHIKQTEGWLAFYKGYTPTILGIIPYAGTSFCTYGTLKKFYRDKMDSNTPAVVNLIFGAISGIVGQSTSYPLDIVRRRMQTSVITGYECSSIIGTFQKIYKEEGLRKGFFKGVSMNWIKGPIAVGISFATYEHVKETLSVLIMKTKTVI
ncbi:hypothetical protein PGB90_001917 [Kerria lacca]